MKNIVLLLFDIVSYISDKVNREDKNSIRLCTPEPDVFARGLTGTVEMWYNLSGQTGI